MQSALYAVARRSVRPSVTRVDHSKTVKVMIRVRKNTQFSANKSPYLTNGARYDQSYYNGLIGIRIWYALSIGTKIIDLARPSTTNTHFVAAKMLFRANCKNLNEDINILSAAKM